MVGRTSPSSSRSRRPSSRPSSSPTRARLGCSTRHSARGCGTTRSSAARTRKSTPYRGLWVCFPALTPRNSGFSIGDNSTAIYHFGVLLDPLSEVAQKYTSLFEVRDFSSRGLIYADTSVSGYKRCRGCTSSSTSTPRGSKRCVCAHLPSIFLRAYRVCQLPLKRFYRYNISPRLTFDEKG